MSRISPFKDLLDHALNEALDRCARHVDLRFDPVPETAVDPCDRFFAEVVRGERKPSIKVSSGAFVAIEDLWQEALQSNILIDASGNRLSGADGKQLTIESLTHLSASWLMLHELMHVRLDHLAILETASIIECRSDLSIKPPASDNRFFAGLAGDDYRLVRPCLELQADNEATEILFGAYAESEWNRFRIEAAAIFVVMALMERTEQEAEVEPRTYPKVATRFFSLFSQLFQYWLYPPGSTLRSEPGQSFVKPAQSPTGEEFGRYMKHVLALAVNDAIQIALIAGAKGFLKDMGAGAGFFSDLYQIQYAPDLAMADLQTPAAREWRSLLPVNERIMAAAGWRDLS